MGPGISRDLVVNLDPGTYVTSCDPGMDGNDIPRRLRRLRGRPGSGTDRPRAGCPRQGIGPVTWLTCSAEVDSLATKTKAFADAFAAGDDDTADRLYADARVHWERIEPIAESFGDLDPMPRPARGGPRPRQEQWLGWHHAEKVLWPPAEGYAITDADTRRRSPTQLVTRHRRPQARVNATDFAVGAVPDRQRRKGTARRARRLQDHGRRGDLVGNRPVGHPGQHRRRIRGLRVAAAHRRDHRARHS